MTFNQVKDVIGKRAFIRASTLGDISIEVEVMDLKVSYGRGRYLVKPVAGTGEAWVEFITLKDFVEQVEGGK